MDKADVLCVKQHLTFHGVDWEENNKVLENLYLQNIPDNWIWAFRAF